MGKNQDKKTAKDVDEYLKALPQEARVVLENLRKEIKAAAPEAEEVISYQMPTYRYQGALVHFMAHKDYCSFFVVNKSILETFKNELKDYDTSGTTIHFTTENPLPPKLVEEIVKTRVRENELLAKNKHK